MIQSHRTQVQRTAHYYTIGTPSPKVNYFWFVTHGYGQLASKIIHKFEAFDNEQHLIVAPEGLNKFYWKRPQVGATWMTSQHRLDEIADYTAYLNGLYQQYQSQLSPSTKVILLGFSQGCQTQMRWIMNTLPHFDHLVLWAGILPDDIDYTPQKEYFSTKKIHWVYGNNDEFLNEQIFQWHQDFATQQQLQLQIHSFEGKHIIDRKVLMELWKKEIQ